MLSTSILPTKSLLVKVRLQADAPVEIAQKLVDLLASEEAVHFIEPAHVHRTMNRWASPLIQSHSEHSVFHRFGLTGKGQVVGVADSGLDYGNCFFHDSEHEPKKFVLQLDDPVEKRMAKLTNSSLTTSKDHRKIVGLLAFTGLGARSDFNDYIYGHGTHVAGSIAGSLDGNRSKISHGQDHPGVAPDAKLAFIDSQDNPRGREDPDGLIITDIEDVLLLWPHYAAGARIHAHAWGSGTGFYGSSSEAFDSFLYHHNTSTVFVAAGNDGDVFGFGSVSSPGTAKNVITVM